MNHLFVIFCLHIATCSTVWLGDLKLRKRNEFNSFSDLSSCDLFLTVFEYFTIHTVRLPGQYWYNSMNDDLVIFQSHNLTLSNKLDPTIPVNEIEEYFEFFFICRALLMEGHRMKWKHSIFGTSLKQLAYSFIKNQSFLQIACFWKYK